MAGKKNVTKDFDPLKELTRLHTGCLKAEKEYKDFLNNHVAQILHRLQTERNKKDTKRFNLIGEKTGLFKADRHARRLLYALDAVTQDYINEKDLENLLKAGISISAIGQILEGRTPPTPAEFQKRLDTLKKPGGVTSLGEELGKRTSLAGKRRKK